ncbi:hypothetical protein TKK_0007597 [Trichogramma kaykai]
MSRRLYRSSELSRPLTAVSSARPKCPSQKTVCWTDQVEEAMRSKKLHDYERFRNEPENNKLCDRRSLARISYSGLPYYGPATYGSSFDFSPYSPRTLRSVRESVSVPGPSPFVRRSQPSVG